MIKYIYRIVEKTYLKQVDASGLSIFRIFFSLVLLCEVIQFYYFRHLIFDPVPYLKVPDINFGIGLLIWMVALLFLIVGYQTRVASIINYLLTVVYLGTIRSYEYHMFYVYLGVTFLMMFFTLDKKYSLHNYLKKRAATKEGKPYEPDQTVSQLSYYLPLLIGIGFVYFDSVLYKLTSLSWINGLGMWLPTSLPMSTQADSTFLMNIKWLVIFLGYFTIIFELVFIFLFWKKKFRIPFFIIGVFLHLGIMIEFPIPWFGLGFIAIYMLLVPISFWKMLEAKIVGKTSVNNSPSIIKKENTQKTVKYISWGLIILCLMQLNINYRSSLVNQFIEKIGFKDTSVGKFVDDVSGKGLGVSKTLLGFTGHGLFVDGHFKNYNHIVSVQYVAKDGSEIWLPIIDENGMPGDYLYGSNWAKWTFRVVGNNVKDYRLSKGIKDFTAFWAYKNNVDLNDAIFKIKVKKVVIPQQWEKDYLHKQMENPWLDAGEVIWKLKTFTANITDIESL